MPEIDKDELLARQQGEVDTKLWAMANELRGSMEASEFKNYILGLIFYKFLSNKIVKTINDELKDDGLTFDSAWKDTSMRDDIKELSIRTIGYFLDPSFLFESFVEKININHFTVEDLKEGIKAITSSTIGAESQKDFADLFEDMDLDNNKLGKGEAERSKLIGKIILKINDLNLDLSETNFDVLGHAYEYLIGKFAASAGKKAGEFYTPAQVSELLARIVTLENNNLKTVYDPTCGSGSLLLRVRSNVANPQALKIYGQEMVTTTYNLARMNMLLHGVDYEKFDIANDDTLEKPAERHKPLKFDAVVANPPYSAKWEPAGKEEDLSFSMAMMANTLLLLKLITHLWNI
jgi:type I restriction enzyme M protein